MTEDEASLGIEPSRNDSVAESGDSSGVSSRADTNNKSTDNTDQPTSLKRTSMTPNMTNGTASTATSVSGQQNQERPRAKKQGTPIDPKLLAEVVSMFAPFDDEWSSTTRSIRIDGTVTSVRLENFFWRILGDMAKEQGLQIPQLLTRLSKIARSGETSHSNFTSFIRVCCGRYIDARLAASNQIEGQAMPIAGGGLEPREVPNGI